MLFESRLIHSAMLCGKRILYNNSLWRNNLLLYYSTLFKNGLWKLLSIIKWKKMRRKEKAQQRHFHSKGSSFWCPVRAMQNWSWVLHFIWQSDPQKPPLQYISRLCWGEKQRERVSSGHLTWSQTGELDRNSTQLFLSKPQLWTFLWNAMTNERDDYTEWHRSVWKKWGLIPCLKDNFEVWSIILEGSRHSELCVLFANCIVSRDWSFCFWVSWDVDQIRAPTSSKTLLCSQYLCNFHAFIYRNLGI